MTLPDLTFIIGAGSGLSYGSELLGLPSESENVRTKL
jgi:hypothetical protein